MSLAIKVSIQWIQLTLLGDVSTVITTIAVGALGFLMLIGRIDIRRATQIGLGCFIVIGALTIANGMLRAVYGASMSEVTLPAHAPPALTLTPMPAAPPAAASPFDPYAGAAALAR